jgi:hypothetical protein
MKIIGCSVVVVLLYPALLWGQAKPSCQTIHGRAHLYTGDGQLRIWHIGTHHDFEPDASSWERVQGWLEEGATQDQKQQDPASYAGDVFLYGDFVICPIAPYRKGTVQSALVRSVTHRRYAPAN